MTRAAKIPQVASEFVEADFGDERLNRRLQRLGRAAASAPAESFPRVTQSDGELEGVYRFLSNERVTAERILAPHSEATQARAGDSDVLVLHDTTAFAFRGGTRTGLGHLNRFGGAQSKQGFFGHFAFAVTNDQAREPLGVLGLKTFVRSSEPLTKAITGKARFRRTNKESERWVQMVCDVQERLPNAIHVMDREADAYENYRRLVSMGARFVIRARTGWERIGESDGLSATLPELATQTPIRLKRTVLLSRRKNNGVTVLNKANPPRQQRRAKLAVYAAAVRLPRPATYSRRDPVRGPLPLNVVYVHELRPPASTEPVCWMLLTKEPIDTRQQIESVVDAYRARWMIEEYFKALKTGCAFERRQLESFAALRNALALFSVIAWRLLLLRAVARMHPSASASAVATTRQLRVLRSLSTVDDPRVRHLHLPQPATAADVLLAVAKLGGHLEQNGPPGWQVLGRGYDSLLLIELGWSARDQM
jgi:IS4 transposase